MVAPSASRHGLHHRPRVVVIVEGVGEWPRHRHMRTHRHRDSRSRNSDDDEKCLEWNLTSRCCCLARPCPRDDHCTQATPATMEIRMTVITRSRADRALQFRDVPRVQPTPGPVDPHRPYAACIGRRKAPDDPLRKTRLDFLSSVNGDGIVAGHGVGKGQRLRCGEQAKDFLTALSRCLPIVFASDRGETVAATKRSPVM